MGGCSEISRAGMCLCSPQMGNTMLQVVVNTKCGKRRVNAATRYAQNNAYKHDISSSPSNTKLTKNEKSEVGMKPATFLKIK